MASNGDAAAGGANNPAAPPGQAPPVPSGGVGMSGVTLLSDPVDVIIDKLLSVRGARPGKQVDLSEAEVKMEDEGLCEEEGDMAYVREQDSRGGAGGR